MVIDVVDPGHPAHPSILLNLYVLFAKAAPESGVTIYNEAALVKLGFNDSSLVVLHKVRFELFTAMGNLATNIIKTGAFLLIAFPQLVLIVLAVLVSFPIVFAPKPLATEMKSAGVGLRMSLFVFPGLQVSK